MTIFRVTAEVAGRPSCVTPGRTGPTSKTSPGEGSVSFRKGHSEVVRYAQLPYSLRNFYNRSLLLDLKKRKLTHPGQLNDLFFTNTCVLVTDAVKTGK